MHWLSRFWAWLLARPLWQLLLLNLGAIGLFGLAYWLGPHPGALRLETCFYESTFRNIIRDWTRAGRWWFVVSLAVVDSVFPFLYAAFLRKLYERWCRWLGFEPLESIRLLPAVAAGFDLTENALTLAAVAAWRSGAGALGALVAMVAMASLVKWALLFVVALALVVALLQSPWGWAFSTCRFGIVSVLLGGLPLVATSQGQDLLRILADGATGRLQWSLAVLALVAWATSVWYWSRVLLMIRWESDKNEEEDAARRILLWLPRVLGTAAILLVALAFALTRAGDAKLGPWLVWHAVGCAALGGLFLFAVTRRRQWLKLLGLPAVPPRVGSWRQLPRATRTLAHVAIGSSLLLLVLISAWPVPVGQTLGAVAVVFGFSAALAFVGSLAVFLERIWSLRLVALAFVCAAFFSLSNDNHALRLLPGGDLNLRPRLATAFDAWAADRLAGWPEGKPMPVFLVAAEGGGIRAAYWTAVVLGRLSDRHPAFARQVFAVSGVSGGSVGAAAFVSLLRDREHLGACDPFARREGHRTDGLGPLEACAQEVLRQDFLSPVLAKMLCPDLLQWFVPFPVPAFDRARALEGSFTDAYRRVLRQDGFEATTFDAPFASAWPRCGATPRCDPAPAFALPALLLNGTHVKTGRRLLHAPVSWTSEELPEVTDVAELLGADVRLTTAAHDSARFAYVSPAGRLLSLEGRDYDHVVDGGYFENSGAATLQDVLGVLRRSPRTERLRFVVLYLCNSAERCWGAETRIDPDEPQLKPVDMTEVFAPVRALLGARDARGELALAEISRTPETAGFVEFGACPGTHAQRRAPEPLGWQLSEGMRERLSDQAAGRAGAPGNLTSEGCVEALLAGEPRPPACEKRLGPRAACVAPAPGASPGQ